MRGRVEKLTSAHAATLWDAIKGHDAVWTYMSHGFWIASLRSQ